MGDPGDRHIGKAEHLSSGAENEIRPEPDQNEDKRPTLDKNLGEAGGRDRLDLRPAGRAERSERRARLKHEPGRRAHEAGIRPRHANERREIHRRERPVRKRAGDCSHRHEQEKPRRAEPARDWRPEGAQPDAIQQNVSPGPVQKGVGQRRPWLRAADQHMQFPDLTRLLQRGRIPVHPAEQIDQPIRPDGDGQPARNERVIPDDPVLDRHRGPIEGRINADKNSDEAKNHNWRIEHRLAAPRDAARFVCAHTLSSLSVSDPAALLIEAGST